MQINPDFSDLRPKAKSEPIKEMLSVTCTPSGTKVRINSSSLSTILTCMRKANLQLNEKWQSRMASPALAYGSAIHKALEVFYAHPKKEREFPKNFKEHSELMISGVMPEEEHFLYDAIATFLETGKTLAALPDTDKRSLASGIWLLQNYFKVYLKDPFVIHRDGFGPLVERTFALPLYQSNQLSIELFGTIDFILCHEVTGQIIPGDHKTSSVLGVDFFNRLRPNHQYTAYLMGAREILNIDSDCFMVNGIQVKAKPLTQRGGPPLFTRQITERNEQDFEEFRQTVIWAVKRYLEALDSGVWPIGHVDACASYGGCSYLDVCSQSHAIRKNILEAKFIKQ